MVALSLHINSCFSSMQYLCVQMVQKEQYMKITYPKEMIGKNNEKVCDTSSPAWPLAHWNQLTTFLKNVILAWYGLTWNRGSHPWVFIGKGVLKICSKFTGEHQCRSVILIKLLEQLYWNCNWTWVFSCKFAAYLQNIFLQEHPWRVVLNMWKGVLKICSKYTEEHPCGSAISVKL